MRGYIIYFGLILNWLFLLTGCKAGEKVVSHSETTVEVRRRDVPVIIPERKASVAGLISVDDDGHLSFEKVHIKNNPGVDVDATITPDGHLLVDFVAREDTMKVSATDSIKSDIKESVKETVKKPSFIQRFGAYVGWSFIGASVIIGIVLFLRYKLKRLWQ